MSETPEKPLLCGQCAFFRRLTKPGLPGPCETIGQVEDNPLVCSTFIPSNPPEHVNYAALFLSILAQNSNANKHATQSIEQMSKINFNTSDLQGEFNAEEFLNLCSVVSGLASIKQLCEVFGLPEQIKIEILSKMVTKMLR